MNILMAATNIKRENGGVCTHILDLCRGLKKTGDHVVLLADGTDYADEIGGLENVSYYEMPFYQMFSSPKVFIDCYRRISSICRAHDIDVIHLHGQRIIPLAWLIRCQRHIPFLWTNHIDEIPQRKQLAMMQKTMRFPVISVSKNLQQQLIGELKIREEDTCVINNGIDIDAYTPLTTEQRKKLRIAYGIAQDEYVIAEMARLTYGKGQDLLIRAVEKVQKQHPELQIKVLFAGSGQRAWFEEQVLSYAKQNGISCEYLGFQRPQDIFGLADLSALPSLYEGFGLVCTEALSMRCPVVRSDSPGWSDMEPYCVVCRKNDIDDLARALEYAIMNPDDMRRRAALGRTACETTFNLAHMVECTRNKYEKVILG